MKPIMLARAAYVLVFAEVADEIGTPVARELQRARLPILLGERPDAYVPGNQALRFIRSVERREGLDDIGFLAAQRVTCSRLSGHCAAMFQAASTLHDLFRRFAELVRLENTDVRMSMAREGENVRIRNDLISDVHPHELRYSEWMQLVVMMDMIRTVKGPAWRPQELCFRSHFVPCDAALESFSGTEIKVGQESTSILVPTSLMSDPMRETQTNGEDRGALVAKPDLSVFDALDFRSSLGLTLRAYLPEGHPTIQLAAEIAGTSVRTFQRRLALLGTSYSDLVQQVRFEAATGLLADPSIRMSDIALAVGYENQANFTRAFRRIAGSSPTDYRKQRIDS